MQIAGQPTSRSSVPNRATDTGRRGGRPRAFGDAALEKLSLFIPTADAHLLRILAAERQQTVSQIVAAWIQVARDERSK